jgi:N-acetylneuraminic acid mutarotase
MRAAMLCLLAFASSVDVSAAGKTSPWSRGPDIPIRVQGAAIGAIGGAAYLAGGFAPVSVTDYREYSSLWSFDPSRDTWTKLPDMPYPHYMAAAGVSDGIFYVAGGANLEGGVPVGNKNVLSRRLEAYDPRRETWTVLAPVPTPGMSRGAFLDGIFYVFGAQCSSMVEAYDPATDSWSKKANMPTPRCAPGVAATGGRLYVFGGEPSAARPSQAAEAYDPKTDSWSVLPPMPTARNGLMTAVLNGRIHALGGWTGYKNLSVHEVFDPRTERWYGAAPLPGPRSTTGAAAINGKLYVFGGRADRDNSVPVSKTSNEVLVYDPAKDRLRLLPSAKPVARADRPAPGRAPIPAPDLIPSRHGKERPDDFALVVGVERYRSLPAATYAERDAAAFARYAQAVLGVPEENTILLTGERAAKTDIAKYVEEWLPRNVEKRSRVFVFYSGHGAPDPREGTAHLVPWDGDPAFLQTTGYPLERLYEQLGRLKAREVVVMLDACFSGAGGRSVIASGLRPLVLVQEAVIPKGSKLTVLAAASGDEVAGSLDAQRHGLFTYYLLKGLDGAADPKASGHVSVDDLHGYVRKNVLRSARRQNREQTPVLRTPDKGLRLY